MSEKPAFRVNLAARAAAAEARRTRTRERLLDAAEAVIADKGFRSASIEDFVAAAGVSRGTFYNYFPTTAALLQAMNQRVAGDIDRDLDQMGASIADPVARLAATLHAVAAATQGHPVRGWLARQLAASSAPRAQIFEDRFAAIFREAVEAGRFRPVAMTSAKTLAFGAVRMALGDITAGRASPAQAVEVVALILSAFGVPHDEALDISRRAESAVRGAKTRAV